MSTEKIDEAEAHLRDAYRKLGQTLLGKINGMPAKSILRELDKVQGMVGAARRELGDV